MRIAVLGIGLIGGSIAQALDEAHEVVGFDPSAQVREQAAAWGLEVADASERAVVGADLVVLAAPVPVNGILLEQVQPGSLVTDVGSVKGPIVDSWSSLATRPQLVPGHPMAGAETAGWEAARPELFQGARWVLCPGEWSSAEQWVDLCRLVLGLGAAVVPADPQRHDAAAAAISHVPHVVASALGSAAAAGPVAQLARSLAAGSFRDMTRVTASPPERTGEFCFANRQSTAAALRVVQAQLQRALTALDNGDAEAFTALLREGHEARRRYEQVRDHLVDDALPLDLSDPDWAAPLLALADEGGAVVGVERSGGSVRLDVRRPA